MPCFVRWVCRLALKLCFYPFPPLVSFIAVSIERGWGHLEFCGGLQSKQELAHLPAGGVQCFTLVKFVLGGGMNVLYDREAPGLREREREVLMH